MAQSIAKTWSSAAIAARRAISVVLPQRPLGPCRTCSTSAHSIRPQLMHAQMDDKVAAAPLMCETSAYRRQAMLVAALTFAFATPSFAWDRRAANSKGASSMTLPKAGSEDLMSKKAHGTCMTAPQAPLRYGCALDVADQIACYNRDYAEYAGYFLKTKWLEDVQNKGVVTYYDVVTGKPLFKAPQNRSFDEFLAESSYHGWPSFRDDEVIWENVRCLPDGETVSIDGTHLGHNIPDGKNRYCINLVSIAGSPA
mmetsp:Transcript_69522/g.180438  ORF Transcript_69522/g.180438 Transcript_69522/m.180438 type:complete len:254 (-) Transcript_69522:65-826(-)